MGSDFYRFLGRRERLVITALSVAAAVRVFVFAAGFPIFNNVDEMSHFDLVHKYARGQLPLQCLPPYDPGAVKIIAGYHTPEYVNAPGIFPGGRVPPPFWKLRPDEAASVVQERTEQLVRIGNIESCSPPLYYVLAGFWYDLGKLAGIRGGSLVYWVRFLNVPNIVALVWLAYLFAKRYFPDDLFSKIAVPLLVAMFPQDSFFSISADVLSPLLVGLSLLLLLELCRQARGGWMHALTGTLIAAAMLTKVSNWVLVPLLGAAIVWLIRKAHRAQRLGGEILKIAALALSAALPVVFWMARNHFVLGDALGTAAKTAALGWTPKPLLQRWNNSIFTPAGAFDFVTDLARTFWRGEFVWANHAMDSTAMDAVYIASTALLVPIALIAALRRDRVAPVIDPLRWPNSSGSTIPFSSRSRIAYLASAGLLVFFVLFLVWASIGYDYGACVYPSRDRPYFRSGRLMLGALVPFAILYVSGVRLVLRPLRRVLDPLVAVSILTLAILGAEIAIAMPAFRSAYNWFHLP